MKSIYIANLAAILAMLLTYPTVVSVYTIDHSYVDWFNAPIGPRILLLLLFGYWVFPGLLLGTVLSYLIFDVLSFNQGLALDLTFNFVDCIAPVVALYIMQSFRVASFFTSDKIVYRHAIFYCILSSLIVAFSRLILASNQGVCDSSQCFVYLVSNLVGSLSGSFVLFFIFAVFSYAVRKQMISYNS